MSGDREACFGVDIHFGEVDVSLGCGIDDVDVDVLARAETDVGGDDDENVWVGCIPYLLFGRDFTQWREGEFDGGVVMELGQWETVQVVIGKVYRQGYSRAARSFDS